MKPTVIAWGDGSYLRDTWIDCMDAGDELDSLLRCAFFEWQKYRIQIGEQAYDSFVGGESYSTDMNAAWALIDVIANDFWVEGFQLSNGSISEEWCNLAASPSGWAVCFDTGYDYATFSTGKTPALAICRAALKALIRLRHRLEGNTPREWVCSECSQAYQPDVTEIETGCPKWCTRRMCQERATTLREGPP